MFIKSSIIFGLALVFGLIAINSSQQVEQIRFGVRQVGDGPIYIDTKSTTPTVDNAEHLIEFHWESESDWYTQIVVEVTNVCIYI